jgi:peptidoglycan/LPS O-acetylase OafA/YrhL
MVAENAFASEPGASRDNAARVQALDLLRLVAVLGVVLFHYGFRGPAAPGQTLVAIPELAAVARYGFLGVPIFFVISGFVIAYSAQGRTALGFTIARVARIYPTFVLCMTLTCVAAFLLGQPSFQTGLAQWLANLFIAAPALGQPYMDSAYWSLVVEVTFYGWVAILIAVGLFPRRIDTIVLVWLGISVLNELTIDAAVVEKIFLADDSGFFATGLMIHEFYRGRRDIRLQCLLAASVATAVFQAVHNLAWLRGQTGTAFDDWIVAAICLGSIWLIFKATQIRSLPIAPGLVATLGGLTYPLYLLHQKLGYAVMGWIHPAPPPAILVLAIVAGMILLSWLVWRYFERQAQPWTRQTLNHWASRFGWSPKSMPAAGASARFVSGDKSPERVFLEDLQRHLQRPRGSG